MYDFRRDAERRILIEFIEIYITNNIINFFFIIESGPQQVQDRKGGGVVRHMLMWSDTPCLSPTGESQVLLLAG